MNTTPSPATADLSGAPPPQETMRRDRRPLVLLVAVLLVIGIGVQEWVVAHRASGLLAVAQHRALVIAESRAETVSGWLAHWRDVSEPIRNNPQLLLFATKVRQRGVQDSALQEQLPYLQAAIEDFVRQSGLGAAYLVAEDGRAILAAAGSPALIGSQREAARALFPEEGGCILPLRRGPDKTMLFDILWPVHAVQARNAEDARQTEAVLLITLPGVLLTDLLAPGKLLESVKRLYLLQPDHAKDGQSVWVDVDAGTFKPIQKGADSGAFARRDSLTAPEGGGISMPSPSRLPGRPGNSCTSGVRRT